MLQRIQLDVFAGTAQVDATLIVDMCGINASHSVSNINFAANGDMSVFFGDHALVSMPTLYLLTSDKRPHFPVLTSLVRLVL